MDGRDSTPAATVSDAEPEAAGPSELRRLWTPWRMRYVGGGAAEAGCVFCRSLEAEDDVRSLILHRGRQAFAIMNLYPYNTGHLMLVPNEHAASPEGTDPAGLVEMATLLPPTLRALRRVLGCDGFNLGLNVGAVAGAGVADHLHEHVVPRWRGDANFMPILASTMVLPELIPVTYAKCRAELGRELGGSNVVACVVLADGGDDVMAVPDGDAWLLPRAAAAADEALWRAARRAVGAAVGEAELVGWAGPTSTAGAGGGMTFKTGASADRPLPPGSTARWLPTETMAETLGDDASIVAAAHGNLVGFEESR